MDIASSSSFLFVICVGRVLEHDAMQRMRRACIVIRALRSTVWRICDWLKETEMANKLDNALAKVIKDHKVGTYDVGLNNTTLEVAEEVARNL